MATPTPDSYSSASGQPIYAGRLAPVAEVIAQQFGKYRYQTPQLFQTARSEFEPSHLPGGDDWPNDRVGPSYKTVATGWDWDNLGGDWIDATRTRQGTAAWFSVLADKAAGGSAVYAYSVDCTAALQFIQTQDRWNAFFMRCPTAGRTLAGVFNPTYAKPAINVTYVGGATAVLRCRLSGASDGSGAYPKTTLESLGLPAFLEFDKPTAAVQSASMTFTITAHWAGSNPNIEFFIIDPTVNSAPTTMGISSTAELDAGLVGHPSVIGVHRYLDGAQLSEFTLPGGPATSSGWAFDPYIYQDSPTHDFNTYPHKGLGKFINNPAAWSLVNSNFAGDGFQPLAAGVGALRVPMAHDPAVVEGFNTNSYNGTAGSSSYIFMPEPLFGLLSHIFVRYYMRIGTPNGRPYRMPIAQRYQMRQDPAAPPIWADCAGKTGITPSHMTSNGGNSGSSGGGWGWQLRHRWADCTADETGPEVDGWTMGVHMWDYGNHNPVGYRYGGDDAFNDSFSQQGGLAGTMHADTWYCVETELKLNTVFPGAPGYAPDGELRVWVDGRLAMEKTGMVFRSLPLMADSGVNPPYDPSYIKPVRELGVTALWFNWYHGGMTQNTVDRTMFVTGLAYGTSYIGPMKLPTPSLPSWVPQTANTLANVPESNTYISVAPTVDSPPGGWSYNHLGSLESASRTLQFGKVVDDFSGGVYNPYLGTLGSFVFHGGGHAATRWNGVVVYDVATKLYSVWMAASDVCDPLDHANTEYADGQPMSAHTYDALEILGPEAGYPKGALISALRLAAEPYYSDNSTAVHLFDFNNPGAKFARLAAANGWGLAAGGATAYDPDLGRVWWVMNQDKNGYQEYFDLSDHTQKRYMFGGYPPSLGPPSPNTQSLRYDKARKLLICTYTLSGTSTRYVSYLQTTNLAAGWKEATLSTAIPAGNSAFDKASNGWYYLVTSADHTRLWRFQVPATLTDTWTVEAVTPSGATLNSNNTMGKRWNWVEALGAFMFKDQSGVPHQIYRP